MRNKNLQVDCRKIVSKTSKACQPCKIKKKKCDGLTPCSRCITNSMSNSCIYVSKDNEYSPIRRRGLNSILNIEKCLRELHNSPSKDSERMQDKISQVRHLLSDMSKLLVVTIDSDDSTPITEGNSVETSFIKDKCFSFTKFSGVIKDRVSEPVIAKNFGLYSPMLPFSSQGIGWIIKTLLSTSNGKGARSAVRLLLKFLDANSTLSKEEEHAHNMSPLEAYAYFRELSPLNGKKLYDVVLEKLLSENNIQLFTLENNLEKPVRDLDVCINLMERVHRDFFDERIDEEFSSFFENDYVISSFCLELFQRMSFMRILEYRPIDLFLRLVKHRYWIDDILVIKNIITVTCRQGIDIGLNRWEYNIGENEEIADIHRDMWLQCFWWDKWLAFRMGKQPTILSVHCCCLLPCDLVKAGVNFSMSVLSMLQILSSESFAIKTTLKVCYLILSKIIEDCFQNLLYDDDFTGYNSFLVQTEYFKVQTMLSRLLEKYHKVKKEIYLLKQIEERLTESYFTDNDFVEFLMHSNVIKIFIFQSISSAFSRFGNTFRMVENCDLQSVIIFCDTETLKFCGDILLKVLKFNSRALNIKYSWYVVIVFLNMTVLILDNRKKRNYAYYLSLMCAIAKAFSTKSEKGIIHNESPFSRTIKRCAKIILILTRISCEFHIASKKESLEKLDYEFQDYGLDFLNSYQCLLSSENTWFNDILSSDRISDYRNIILKHINMRPQDFSIGGPQYESSVSEHEATLISNLLSENIDKFFEDEIFSSFINTMSENSN